MVVTCSQSYRGAGTVVNNKRKKKNLSPGGLPTLYYKITLKPNVEGLLIIVTRNKVVDEQPVKYRKNLFTNPGNGLKFNLTNQK